MIVENIRMKLQCNIPVHFTFNSPPYFFVVSLHKVTIRTDLPVELKSLQRKLGSHS